MDILLVTTPFLPLDYVEFNDLPLHRQERTSISPPLGVLYLSSYLRKRGYRVSIVDLDLETFSLLKKKGTYSINDIVSLIKKSGHHDIIGISCLTSARYKKADKLAEIAKQLGAVTIMGGNYPTNSPDIALQNKFTDYIVRGEGEEKLWRLLQAIEQDYGFDEIDAGYIENLDNIPFPDYKNIDIERYYDLGMSQSWDGINRFFTLFTSRGCSNQCIYCCSHNTFGHKIRYRSIENVLSEIKWLIEEFGCNELLIQDDNFTKDINRAGLILLEVSKLNLKWSVPNGIEVNTLNREFLEKVKKSGGTDLTIAIESGSPKTLKQIKKNVNLEHAIDVINIMRELGIYSKVFFMLGFPCETKEDISQTISYASRLKADWSIFSIVNSLPGSELSKTTNPVYDDMGYANANINTENFTAKEIEDIVYDTNNNINFFNNPNLNGGNIDWAIRDFKRIYERYPQHILAKKSLERAINEKNLHNS